MAINISQSREHLADFLGKNHVATLATADINGTPHAATVYFTFDKVFNIYFITKKDTQKCRNIEANPKAAIAISDPTAQTTVQGEGSVIQVSDPAQTDWIFNDIWRIAQQTSPSSAPPLARLTAGGYVVYKLAAPSLRMATFVPKDPADYDKIFEIIYTQPSLQG